MNRRGSVVERKESQKRSDFRIRIRKISKYLLSICHMPELS